MTDIPDWAGKRACELLNAEFPGDYKSKWPDHRSAATVALAKLVMQHETKPVDPDEEAVKRIFAAFWNEPVGAALFDPGPLARAVSQYKQEKANG